MVRIAAHNSQGWLYQNKETTMINIYAQTLMHATRTGQIRVQDVPPVSEHKRHRWFSRRKTRFITPDNL